jgi:hypothetical protein
MSSAMAVSTIRSDSSHSTRSKLFIEDPPSAASASADGSPPRAPCQRLLST